MLKEKNKMVPDGALESIKGSYETMVGELADSARRSEKLRCELDELLCAQGVLRTRVAAFEAFLKHLGAI